MDLNLRYIDKEESSMVGIKVIYLKIKNMIFFNYMYYNIYFVSNRNTSSPEIVTVSNISFCQTNNILSFLNLFFFFSKINSNYNISRYYLIIQVTAIILNYYYYVTKKKGIDIMKNEKYSFGNFKFLTFIYLIFSIFLTGFTYYVYREF